MTLLTTYCENGLCLVAIPKGMKGPITSGWNLRENGITNIEQLHLLDDSNIGLGHAYSSPYPTCAIDFDDLIKAKNWFQDKGVEINRYINADDSVQIISGVSNRLKLLFRLKTQLLRSQVIKDDSQTILEFRCATSNGLTVQDVLPPSIHPETQLPYTWGGKGHYSQIPFIPECLLAIWESLLTREDKTKATITSILPETPRNICQVRDALRQIPANCSYDMWRNVVWGILSTGWNCSVDLAMAWSKTAPGSFNEAVFNTVVDGYDANRKDSPTLGTIYYLANKGGLV